MHDFLKALASETRQQILFLFSDGRSHAVGEVATLMNLGQSTTSEHLSLLKRGGLLTSHREGKEVHYEPDPVRIKSTLEKFVALVSRCCPTR